MGPGELETGLIQKDRLPDHIATGYKYFQFAH